MNEILPLYQQGAVYDRMFEGQRDADFYKQLIPRYGADCLEICCGTGRVLLELTAAGLEAYGLDYSTAMLEEARKKANECGLKVQLQEGDMRAFDMGRRFSVILMVANSWSHLHTLDDIQRHLTCVKQHMQENGVYIVNIFTPRLDLLLAKGRQRIMDFVDPADNQTVAVLEEAHYDQATQIKLNHWFYQKGETLTEAGDLPMRMFFPQELDALLTLNGLRIEEKLGDYDGSVYRDGSPIQIVICRRA